MPPQRAGDSGRQPSPNKKLILVADDDAVVTRALAIKLKANGFDVLTAKEGGETVKAVRTQKPDLILLDLTFPVDVDSVSWDGFLIMDWLKRLEEAANIPVVIITAGNSELYLNRARAIGAAAYFHKPINYEELFSYIRRLLKVKTPPPSRPIPPARA